MKISLNWLRDFVTYDGSVKDLADLLTFIGHAVDSVDKFGADYEGVVVGKVLRAEKVPGSDHLSFCEVDAGTGEVLPIVCGAPNVATGQTVPVALVGAKLPGDFLITERKLRGLVSKGMICSQRELGLSEEHLGIMVLPNDWQLGLPVQHYLGQGDTVLDLEITFNRPDCLSHFGIAREIAAKSGLSLTLPKTDLTEIAEQTSNRVSIDILAPVQCPRYSARVVNGVSIKSSPQWMQNRLRAVGIRPISNVVDVTNYVMMELGHPLHAFDYHLVSDGKIVVRNAREGEAFTTLDGKVQQLSLPDLVIADPAKAIALAGVMGGLNSEIVDSTTDVLIECAAFQPVGIRMTSRDRGIVTESSRRFERGVDPEMTTFAATRAAALIQELAGGEVLSGVVDSYPGKKATQKISFRPARCNKMLGTNLPASVMEDALCALHCDVNLTDKGDAFEVVAPSWRGDLEREIDLIEEVIRLHGYSEVEMASKSSVPLDVDPAREAGARGLSLLKRLLVEEGLYEAVSWSLIPAGDAARIPNGLKPVRVINPLSEDLSHLRTTPAQSLLRAAERNINAGNKNVRLYEVGKCFRLEGDKVVESLLGGVILTGDIRPEAWIEKEKTRALSFYDVKGMVESILRKLKYPKQIWRFDEIPEWLTVGGLSPQGSAVRPTILFGQISVEVASSFGIDVPAWYIEFEAETLLGEASRTPRYQPLPKYPAALRDLAFLVPLDLIAADLETVVSEGAGGLLESIALFDQYVGKGIPEGTKSLAFHLHFRSAERTLTDREVDAALKNAIAAARKSGAELRTTD